MLEKLKFWKKEPAFPEPKEDIGAGFGAGKDETAGLGGTGKLGGWPEMEKPAEQKYPTREPGYDVGPPPGLSPTSLQQKETYAPPPASSDVVAKDIELMSAKLDSLKASIETLNQRMANIERMMLEKKKGW